jgi:hypothetical protein
MFYARIFQDFSYLFILINRDAVDRGGGQRRRRLRV